MRRRAKPPGTDWRRLPADPDPELDLGYEIRNWEIVRARKNGTGHVMFLPEDEDLLKQDAFIVANDDDVCDVRDRV